jgi:peptidoglycan hydrolase-like protein with peptidoglycan-binding domain
MNRSIATGVATVAIAALAGMAQAQTTSSSPSTAPTARSPYATAPSTTGTTGAATMPSSGGAAMGADATLSQPSIQQAQQQLKAQGLYNGPIDGVIGPETKQALSQFQQQNGLPQTATLDQQTMSRLMAPGSNPPASMSGSTQQPMTSPSPSSSSSGSYQQPRPSGTSGSYR